MKHEYEGKRIWIIGASSGIGRALAVALAEHGATLALSARRKDALETLNNQLSGDHLVLPLDVADGGSLTRAAHIIQSSFPALDSVIFLAAVYTPDSLTNMNIEDVGRLVDINVKGALHTIHAALPVFAAQGKTGGQIILYASVSGYCGLPYSQPYSASKAALINLAETLRCEQADTGLDVKVINSGFVATPMTAKNDFAMPFCLSAEEAAACIIKGMRSKAFEIHFPKSLTLMAKILRLMPYWVFFPVTKWITRRWG